MTTAAGTGRGATWAFQTASLRLRASAIGRASRPRSGMTWTNPLWMKSVSMPRSTNLAGFGSGGRTAATSTRDRTVDALNPNCERIRLMSNLASTSLSLSACGAAAAGAVKREAVNATGAS
ncbi:MAG: hypothetical protein ACRDTT_03360 [Pseudonocardiaceae bacterium]